MPKRQPTATTKGKTNKPICTLEPRETLMERSILSFLATSTAVACSAPLPTTGSKMRLIKDGGGELERRCHLYDAGHHVIGADRDLK